MDLPALPYDLPENREPTAAWNPAIGDIWTYRGPTFGTGWAPPPAAAITVVDPEPPPLPPVGSMWFNVVDDTLMVWNGTDWVPAVPAPLPPVYSIGFSFVGGVLVASQLLGLHRVSRAVTFPANFSGAVAGATANATVSTVIDVAQAAAATPNTFTSIGTITIAAGSITPTFATTGGTAKTLAIGDVVRVQGPATADATLANFYCTIVGQ